MDVLLNKCIFLWPGTEWELGFCVRPAWVEGHFGSLSEGGVDRERENFSICTPPPGREFRTKGKKGIFGT